MLYFFNVIETNALPNEPVPPVISIEELSNNYQNQSLNLKFYHSEPFLIMFFYIYKSI